MIRPHHLLKNPFKNDGISMKPEKERNRVANSVSPPFAPKKIFRQTNGPSYHSIIFSHIFLKPFNTFFMPFNCAGFVVFDKSSQQEFSFLLLSFSHEQLTPCWQEQTQSTSRPLSKHRKPSWPRSCNHRGHNDSCKNGSIRIHN